MKIFALPYCFLQKCTYICEKVASDIHIINCVKMKTTNVNHTVSFMCRDFTAIYENLRMVSRRCPLFVTNLVGACNEFEARYWWLEPHSVRTLSELAQFVIDWDILVITYRDDCEYIKFNFLPYESKEDSIPVDSGPVDEFLRRAANVGKSKELS